MIVRHSALVVRSAETLFDLIEAAENYPRFLPWCAGASIVSRTAAEVSADIHVNYHGVRFGFRTRNPKRRPVHMTIHLEQGPFRRFEGEWILTVLAPEACKVEFTLDYEFDSALMTRMAGPAFAHISGTLVDAFVRRAESLPQQAGAAALVPAKVPDVPHREGNS